MSSGNIIIVGVYTRDMIRRNPDMLFVFGDNLKRVGFGGQAAEARGEPNSVGIPTKISPSTYFENTEDHFQAAKEPIVQAFVRLAQHLRSGKHVVWPRDGVGTGLADLPRRAPEIFRGIEDCKQALFLMADNVMNTYL